MPDTITLSDRGKEILASGDTLEFKPHQGGFGGDMTGIVDENAAFKERERRKQEQVKADYKKLMDDMAEEQQLKDVLCFFVIVAFAFLVLILSQL